MAIHASPPSATAPLSEDAALRPFLTPTFDAADHLNAILPAWPTAPSSSTASGPQIYGAGHSYKPQAVAADPPRTLADVANQTQALVTQLDAQLARLTSSLTSLTDEMLRSGTRLAYEIEVLRGDASSLGDVLGRTLSADLARFGLDDDPAATAAADTAGALRRLHTLARVRDRLDAVVQTFGRASEWPLAPSAVGGPGGLGAAEAAAAEARAVQFEKEVRDEVQALVASGRPGDVEAAVARVDEFRTLAEVWKGTAEERARARWVEGLAKFVEERRRVEGGGGYGLPTKR